LAEEMLQKQFEIQKQYYEAEAKLAAQFQKVMGNASLKHINSPYRVP